MMYQILSAINCVGSTVSLCYLVSFARKKEYNACYHTFLILFISGLIFLVLASIYLFLRDDISWVMRLFGLVYWAKSFFFIHAMKCDYKRKCCDTEVAKVKADQDCDEKLKA